MLGGRNGNNEQGSEDHGVASNQDYQSDVPAPPAAKNQNIAPSPGGLTTQFWMMTSHSKRQKKKAKTVTQIPCTAYFLISDLFSH